MKRKKKLRWLAVGLMMWMQMGGKSTLTYSPWLQWPLWGDQSTTTSNHQDLGCRTELISSKKCARAHCWRKTGFVIVLVVKSPCDVLSRTHCWLFFRNNRRVGSARVYQSQHMQLRKAAVHVWRTHPLKTLEQVSPNFNYIQFQGDNLVKIPQRISPCLAHRSNLQCNLQSFADATTRRVGGRPNLFWSIVEPQIMDPNWWQRPVLEQALLRTIPMPLFAGILMQASSESDAEYFVHAFCVSVEATRVIWLRRPSMVHRAPLAPTQWRPAPRPEISEGRLRSLSSIPIFF